MKQDGRGLKQWDYIYRRIRNRGKSSKTAENDADMEYPIERENKVNNRPTGPNGGAGDAR